MNTEKISIQEIADELSAKLNITKRASEEFIKTLFGTIEEALLNGDLVKIKDFGIFKPQLLEPRKSVNIQTGEEIIIPGHTKVSFTPETSLKELVNEPFAHLESVVLDNTESAEVADNSHLHHFTEQATEIKSIISDIEALSYTEKESEEEIKVTYKMPNEMKNNEIEEEPFLTKNTEQEKENDEDLEYYPYERKRRTWLWVSLILLAILIGFVIYVFIKCPETAERFKFWKQGTTVEQIATTDTTNAADTTAIDGIDELQVLFDTPRVYNEYLATVRLPAGSYLAHLARDYYGHPYFWVYIYEANKDNIKYPNYILIGKTVRVPKVNPMLIDASNPRCLEKAQELERIYLKK